MQLQFDSHQDYQLRAVAAVSDLFKGQAYTLDSSHTAALPSHAVVANQLLLSAEQLLLNLQQVQQRNQLPPSEQLVGWGSGSPPICDLDVAIAMETGTGKTYTYLRTIYELHEQYGFKKFVIVVPSIAIREGVKKNIAITQQHFSSLYQQASAHAMMYDGSNKRQLIDFAQSNHLHILVINIDSFAKDNNIIHAHRDGTYGKQAIEYLRATRPIVIVDEPQNFETELRRTALRQLQALCVLRYSATHRSLPHLVYSLSAIDAYRMGLVKQIEVDGVTTDDHYNAAFVQLKGLTTEKTNYRARLLINANTQQGVRQKEVKVGFGHHDSHDLYELSGGRAAYKGYQLSTINRVDGWVAFDNGVVVSMGESVGGLTDEVMRFQIERTVKWHFEKLSYLKTRGVKVLSLFFIDKVANYRSYDVDGNAIAGKFARWFEAAFAEQQKAYPQLLPFAAHEVHNGYFSGDKVGSRKWTDTKGTTAKDDDTYRLIMRDKERLLSLHEPLQFIFSHSALREGWDNPNVLQICTLNETRSELKRRQEIGRGMRLLVNEQGERLFDRQWNVLTVIANESYEAFTEQLQQEITDELPAYQRSTFIQHIANAQHKVAVQRNCSSLVFDAQQAALTQPLLHEIWQHISPQTRYRVAYHTQHLIEQAVAAIRAMPATVRPLLNSQTARIVLDSNGLARNKVQQSNLKALANEPCYTIPDVYAYVQHRVAISRSTIYSILTQSDRYDELLLNPQMYLDNVVLCLRRTLERLLVDGVTYEAMSGQYHAMALLADDEITTQANKLYKVQQKNKTIFDHIRIDNDQQKQFAQACEADDHVLFFFRLPNSFHIPTPLGGYTPTWALLLQQHNQRICLVADTSTTPHHPPATPTNEQLKIQCGKQHFAALHHPQLQYRVINSLKEVY